MSAASVEVIRIPYDDVAAQFTLIDFELFKKIELEELTGSGWIKKNKNDLAPNVVNYTKRFNHVCQMSTLLMEYLELDWKFTPFLSGQLLGD